MYYYWFLGLISTDAFFIYIKESVGRLAVKSGAKILIKKRSTTRRTDIFFAKKLATKTPNHRPKQIAKPRSPRGLPPPHGT